MIEKALKFNPKHSWAWSLKGNYYLNNKNYEKAEECYKTSDNFNYNKNDFEKCIGKLGRSINNRDYSEYVENFCYYLTQVQKAEDPQPWTSWAAVWNLYYMGFPDLAKNEAKKLSEFRNNQFQYDDYLYQIELKTGNFQKAKEVIKSNFENYTDIPQRFRILYQLMYVELITGNELEAYRFLKQLEAFAAEHNFNIDNEIPIAWLYLKNGRKEEAESMLQKMETNSLKGSNGSNIQYTHGIAESILVDIYAIRGDKEKAYQYMEILTHKKAISQWMIIRLKNYPWVDGLRNEPEFKELLLTIENKWEREHNRLKKLYVKAGLLE